MWGGGCTGQFPALLIGVRALHPQLTLHLYTLIEGLRLFAYLPIGTNHPLNVGFHHFRLFSQGLPRGDVDAVGTPLGIMGRYIEQIAGTLCCHNAFIFVLRISPILSITF